MVVVLVGVQGSMIANGTDHSRHPLSTFNPKFLYILTTTTLQYTTCFTTEAWRASHLKEGFLV